MASLSWADLPDDLLFLLANRVVGVATFIRFSAVCKSWCSIASATKCYKPAPWLMLSEKEGSDLRDFYDHSTGELYQFQLSHAQGMKIVGSAHGWIITAGKDASFHLLNPVCGTHIALPPQTAFPSVHLGDFGLSPDETRGLFMIKAACSSIEPNGDFIVAATHMGDDNLVLSFCRSTDAEWTTFEVLALKEVGFVGGDFYAVSAFGDLYICNFSSPPELIQIADLRALGDFFGCDFYIVGCANEILVAVKVYGFTEEEISYTTRFRVFKLDVGSEKMVEVKSIGDYALFLGVNNSICLPITSEDKLFKRNSIYFTDDRQEEIFAGEIEGGDDMGVFNLEDGSITTYYSDVSKSFYSLPTWVTVNPL